MEASRQNLLNFVLGLGDDSLVLGQRLCEWCTRAPTLEEDIAMANVALDFIGRAQMLLEYASELDSEGRSPDELAFLRDSRDFRNLLIAELPMGDFAHSMARQFMVDQLEVLYFDGLRTSSDARLAAISTKVLKECRYHLRRSRGWVVCLGDGTQKSRRLLRGALEALWGYAGEMFEMSFEEEALLATGVSVDRQGFRAGWDEAVATTLAEARLACPRGRWSASGGRRGLHTEYHAPLLCEMQFMQRAYPGLKW